MSAADILGAAVPVPDGVDPAVWRSLCARVLILPGGCHVWTGPPRDDGYAQVWVPPGTLAAYGEGPARPWRGHRFAYAALTGAVLGEEDHVLHQCDQPMCVCVLAEELPRHHKLGTNAANVREREQRGRGTRRGRWGLSIPSRADRRGQYERSLALHNALVDALGIDAVGRPTKDVDRGAVAARVAEVEAAGRYEAAQPVLPIFEEPTP